MINKLIGWAMVLMLLACSEKPVKPIVEADLQVASLRLPERWNLNASDSSIVEIKVSSSTGFSELEPVVLQVFNATSELVFEGLLYDDGGTSGSTDLLAGDGVFRNRFAAADIATESGNYLFTFYINDNVETASLEFSRAVIFNFNQTPQIVSAPSLSLLESGAQAQLVQVITSDEDSAPENVAVYLDLLFDNTSVLAEPLLLANDGNITENGDVFADDSIHSMIIDSTFAAARQGSYTMVFFARDEFEDKSSPLQNVIQIENKAGHIITTDVPETVFRPANIPIKAKVSDPQGWEDIQRVYFELKASDGSYIESSPGNHLQLNMFDNGNTPANGDTLANDSEYSLILAVTEANVADIYTLEFYTVDKVANVSLMVSDTLDIQ